MIFLSKEDRRNELKKAVQEGYSSIAKEGGSCCPQDSCCGPTDESITSYSEKLGYSLEELAKIPEGADLGLGCGNPTALGSLKKGEVVLDLGSGAGLDCFLAAQKVGQEGKVVGIDMTQDMVSKARENAKNGGYQNVEFRLGEIENLPVDDNSVDVILSNCVINLSPEKGKVFREAYRVLKPGGRMMISDVVLLKELPEKVKNSLEAYIGCVAGAEEKNAYLNVVKEAGFKKVQVIEETPFPADAVLGDPAVGEISRGLGLSGKEIEEIAGTVVSLKFMAHKGK